MQHSSYLESKILTASPVRLHLMLIEGAMRFGRQAEESLLRGDAIGAATPFLRMLDIVGELLAGVRHNKSELNQKLAEVYWFLFRRVTEAKINSDQAALGEVLVLLEFERQTWQMACDKLSAGNPGATPAPLSHVLNPSRSPAAKSGISFEA